ncbi:UNKNOWN [Stylonychia lemnae]|uniref:CS domain-containing protein n=1 Tax=Stylonychia lemnae TaxID=5949 RepID=A0A078ALL6_STYLE|nr:UNKNOWN [Stylonychia lemnae]|eukprot:CDW83250.1 UNKNOWN [Stylonychia lemnae]
MKYHTVQVNNDGVIIFTGFQKTQSLSNDYGGKVYHFSEQLHDQIQYEKSGQKQVAGWLQLYLRKKKEVEGEFWPFIFKNQKLQKSPKIKADWDKWHYEEEEKDMLNDFDPDKLIDLMKKNGEWDEEDDEIYGPETIKQMQQDQDEENEDKYDKNKKQNPEDENEQDSDEQEENNQEDINEEQLYKKRHKSKKSNQQSFMDKLMSGAPPDDDNDKVDDKEDDNDEFLYEKYLRSGGYLGIKRKPQTEEELERQLLDEDQLIFAPKTIRQRIN